MPFHVIEEYLFFRMDNGVEYGEDMKTFFSKICFVKPKNKLTFKHGHYFVVILNTWHCL